MEIIINVMAVIASRIPMIIFVVRVSPKTIVPTRMAVIGSNTPKTEALVAPIFRVAIANVAVETIVGSKARPIRFNHAPFPSMPVVIGASESVIFIKKITAPTVRA